jgi:hypothetical protein
LEACFHPDDPAFMERMLAMSDLQQRHASEVLDVLTTMVAREAQGLTHRALPERSLLRHWLGEETPGGARIRGPAFGVRVGMSGSSLEKIGRVWVIRFRDERHGMNDSAGMMRLAQLVKAQGQSLEALDLMAGSAPGRRATSEASTRNGENPKRRSLQGDTGTIVDEHALRDYAKRLEDLAPEILVAEQQGQTTTVDVLRREQAWLEHELRAARGLGGRLRNFPDEHENARSAVSKAIWGRVKELQQPMPQLHAHLRQFLKLGYLCCYAPEPPEPWEIT